MRVNKLIKYSGDLLLVIAFDAWQDGKALSFNQFSGRIIMLYMYIKIHASGQSYRGGSKSDITICLQLLFYKEISVAGTFF